jgi:hypothetical protein
VKKSLAISPAINLLNVQAEIDDSTGMKATTVARKVNMADENSLRAQFAVGILVMNDSRRIGSRRDSFEVATRLRISNFDHHYVLHLKQKIAREALWSLEERATPGSGILRCSNIKTGSPNPLSDPAVF